MATLLPKYKKAIHQIKEHAEKCLSADNKKSKRPFTLDQGKDKLPFVSVYYTGTIADLINVAHEFAHAVQIVISRKTQTKSRHFMPPLYRECCAFLGEIALIYSFEKEKPDVYQQLKAVWINENIKYLSLDATELKQAIKNNALAYSYNWNYPIARLYALMLRRQFNNKTRSKHSDFEAVFSSGAMAESTVSIKKLIRHLPLPNPLPLMPRIEGKGLTKYQKLGAITALYTSSYNLQDQTSVDEFYKKMSQHIADKTVFIQLKGGKPVGYACWNKENVTDKKSRLVLSSLCLPYVSLADFKSFMAEVMQCEIIISDELLRDKVFKKAA